MATLAPPPETCARCGQPVLATDNFCEDCGQPLPRPAAAGGAAPAGGAPAVPAPASAPVEAVGAAAPAALPCPGCGAEPDQVDAEGYCARCGLARRPAPGAEHWEERAAAGLAGVSDRGGRRPRNEDVTAVAWVGQPAAAEAVGIAVVCDGVSRSQHAGAAARAAADAARAALTAPAADPEAAMRQALAAAAQAVAAVPGEAGSAEDPPESTIVAARVRVRAGEAVVGWVGDSRAYFVGPTRGVLLTRDHSWLNDVVSSGELTEPEALTRPNAHALTRTLGGETPAAPDRAAAPGGPSEPFPVVRWTAPEPGWLVLCSDGLWNYYPEPSALVGLVRSVAAGLAGGPDRPLTGADALLLARALVEVGRRRGGQDNLSVAVVALTPPGGD